jgi:hypothetical protein
MTVLAAPQVIAAHVDTLPTLDGWAGVRVFDGVPLTRGDVREWCTVGYVDGDTGPAVSLEPVPTAQGAQTREAGTVLAQLVVAAKDVPTARGRVFDLLAAWAGWLVADRTTSGRLLPSEVHLSVDVSFVNTRPGITASAVVTITYTATTYG